MNYRTEATQFQQDVRRALKSCMFDEAITVNCEGLPQQARAVGTIAACIITHATDRKDRLKQNPRAQTV